MVFNVTFNNISVISLGSVLLVEETENQEKPPTCRKSLTNFTSPRAGFKPTTSVVICTDCIGSKSNHDHGHNGPLGISGICTYTYVYRCTFNIVDKKYLFKIN